MATVIELRPAHDFLIRSGNLPPSDFAFQDWSPQRGKIDTVAKVSGADLVGCFAGDMPILPSNVRSLSASSPSSLPLLPFRFLPFRFL